jgi:N-acetylmuramoyl-L-alanine amidase
MRRRARRHARQPDEARHPTGTGAGAVTRPVRLAALAALALGLAPAGCGGDGPEVPHAEPTGAQTVAPTSARTVPRGGAEGAPAAAVPSARRPPILQWRIPFPPRRKREMAAYSWRHYGIRDWRLRDPKVIVEHWTQVGSVRATRAVFVPDRPDSEVGELPGTCAHFVISRRGTIYQLVDLGIQCRHAFGVNYTSVGIEHVGFSDGEVMGNRRQLAASLALSHWLRCRYGIRVRDVLGHAETASSRWWRERDPHRRRQTHGDFGPRAMRAYRAALARRACP